MGTKYEPLRRLACHPYLYRVPILLVDRLISWRSLSSTLVIHDYRTGRELAREILFPCFSFFDFVGKKKNHFPTNIIQIFIDIFIINYYIELNLKVNQFIPDSLSSSYQFLFHLPCILYQHHLPIIFIIIIIIFLLKERKGD